MRVQNQEHTVVHYFLIAQSAMSENPLQLLVQAFGKVSNCIQSHLSHFVLRPGDSSSSPPSKNQSPLLTLSSPSTAASHLQPPGIVIKGKSSGPTTKEDLGRATWTFRHTLAAQYPDKPTRQQKKDVKELMTILSRMYPCKECADHFKEVIRSNPPQTGSHHEFSQWLCHVHNVVNRSLGKVVFPCERVDARWGKLECEQRACDLQGTSMDLDDRFK